MFALSQSLVAALALLPLALTQSFIPQPQDTTILASTALPGATLSYKPNTLCDTHSYAGYITLPVLTAGEPYNASLFFWYFPAAHAPSTAPTTLWLPGGPATSFLDGSSGFPCAVGADGNSTTRNAFALNAHSNMLYVDIPVQAGYSYAGRATNGTFDVARNLFTPLASSSINVDDDNNNKNNNNNNNAAAAAGSIVLNASTTVASMGSLDGAHTANTTAQIAAQVWAFAQVWLQEFPHQAVAANRALNIWSYSYSGFFGAASAAYITAQNELVARGTYAVAAQGVEHPVEIELGTLGINNGCVDIESQLASFPEMLVNNTYGIKAVPDALYVEARELVEECYGLVADCRTLAAELDPEGTGNVDAVNAVCVNTTTTCFDGLLGLYLESNRTQFDLALPLPGMWAPFGAPAAFYNQRWVQEELGVPVNFTLSADAVVENFFTATGDPMLPTYNALETILDAGVGLAFVYGDRDYQCNWMGVENVSLSMDYDNAAAFRAAGYAPIHTNASYTGGLVRQHDRVSFSRVFQAGHDTWAYQPETMQTIFERAILGKDVATGTVDLATTPGKSCSSSSSSSKGKGSDYSTTGALDVRNVTNRVEPPVMAAPLCWWYTVADGQTCSAAQMAAVEEGTAVVEEWVVVSPPSVFSATSGNPVVRATAAAKKGY